MQERRAPDNPTTHCCLPCPSCTFHIRSTRTCNLYLEFLACTVVRVQAQRCMNDGSQEGKEGSAAANIKHHAGMKQNKSTSTCKQPDAMVSHKSRKRRRQCRTKTSIVPLGVIKEDAEFLSEAIPSSLGVLQVVSVGMDDAVIME